MEIQSCLSRYTPLNGLERVGNCWGVIKGLKLGAAISWGLVKCPSNIAHCILCQHTKNVSNIFSQCHHQSVRHLCYAVSPLTPGCIQCKPHAGGTPVASQVYAKVEGWRTPEVQRSKEPCAEICVLLRPYAKDYSLGKCTPLRRRES